MTTEPRKPITFEEMNLHLHQVEAADTNTVDKRSAIRPYAWIVFALTVGLLLSDYMSRQVLNAVFPLLKSTWNLSDTQLGSLSSVVALIESAHESVPTINPP